MGDVDEDAAPKRKKLTIKTDDESTPSLVKKMMSMDDLIVEDRVDKSTTGVHRKKIRIMADTEPESTHPSAAASSAPLSDSKAVDPGKVTGGEYDNEGQTQR